MTTEQEFRELALSLPESSEHQHFENKAFKVNKKIFATLNVRENRACLKFNEIDQSVFCSFDKKVIFPVPNKWGKQGWTLVNLLTVPKEMLQDALATAFRTVAPKRLIKDEYFDS